MRKISWSSATLALLGILATGADAIAGTAAATMTNTVTITNNCTVSTVGFTSAYDPISTNATVALNTTASITSTCTLGSAPVITLGQGLYPGTGSTAAAPVRRLSNGATTPVYLNYSLYQDSAHSVTWGNTAGTGVSTVGTGVSQMVTVYGQVPAGQTAASAGTYTDQVVVTLTY